MTVNGTYRSIEPHSRIVFSWNIEPPDEHAGLQTEVVVVITAAGDGSELHIRPSNLRRQAPPNATARAGMELSIGLQHC
jgi:uncharacterized protein YndB with AHSA1/START domain